MWLNKSRETGREERHDLLTVMGDISYIQTAVLVDFPSFPLPWQLIPVFQSRQSLKIDRLGNCGSGYYMAFLKGTDYEK